MYPIVKLATDAPSLDDPAPRRQKQQSKVSKEFTVPIFFQGGLSVQECEHYYNCLEGDSKREASRRRQRINYFRQDDSVGDQPSSCLRKKSCPCVHKTRTRRTRSASISFQPRDRWLTSETQNRNFFATTDTLLEQPRVSFQDHVVVIPVDSLKNCPADVRERLWVTDDELAFSIRQAKIHGMREQRERLVEALIDDDKATEEGHSQLEPNDSTDEEGSIDFLDLVIQSGLHEVNSISEGTVDKVCQIHSRQVR